MSQNQYSPSPDNVSAGLERNFASQPDIEIRRLLKKILRQDEEIATLLRFMCFAMLRTYERGDTLGLDYAAMMSDLKPHSRKKKRRISPNFWNSYDWR